MRLILRGVLVLTAIVCAAWSCLGQTTESQAPVGSKLLAQQELNQAAASYREGKFEDAQIHSEKALAWDPNNKTAPFFIARCLHAQCRPGVTTEENIAKAQQTIAAYKRILERVPGDEESYKAIAYLLAAIKEEETLRDWVLRRAADTSVAAAKRAEAYIVLASKDWDCSFKMTELPTAKETTVTGKKLIVRYVMPKDGKDFEEAKQCANRGLTMVELAIGLDPENESAWSYKTNLLLEQAKLSEMANDEPERRRFYREYDVALAQTTRFAKANQKKREKEEETSVAEPKP
jgi:tetratricopeptide (TPR) repeat protein